jgi:hypothetical protein
MESIIIYGINIFSNTTKWTNQESPEKKKYTSKSRNPKKKKKKKRKEKEIYEIAILKHSLKAP